VTKEGQIMDEKYSYGLWGVAAGAAALAIVGFTWGGWVTDSKAEASAKQRADAAVVTVMTPICIQRFQGTTNAVANLVELKQNNYSWTRRDYVAKGGWASIGKDANIALADACAEALNKL
jgi:hypothetical protein